MRNLLWVSLPVVGLIVAGALWLSFGSSVGTAAPAPAADNPFEGKVILVYGRAGDQGAVLEKVVFHQIGGRTFLLGRGLDADESGTPNPWAGQRLWFALDDVSKIMEFNSTDDVKKAYRAWGEMRKAAAGGGF